MYKIGFPVDGGTAEYSFLVKVRLVLAKMHFCKNGKRSGLRSNSGAEFVFQRAPLYVQKRYRFEFSPVPMPNPTTRPDNLASAGYSDSLACALSLYQKKFTEKKTKLLLFSGAFSWTDKDDLSDVFLEKVTIENEKDIHSSLFNKWNVAQRENATALFLHQEDAEMLKKHYDIPFYLLSRGTPKLLHKTKETIVISYQANQFPLLKKTINQSYKPVKLSSLIFILLAFMITFYAFLYYGQKVTKKMDNFDLLYSKFVSQIQYQFRDNRALWKKQINNELKTIEDKFQFIQKVLKKLNSVDWKEQYTAIYILGELKQKSATEKILGCGNLNKLWKEAIISLRKISPSLKDIIPFITRKEYVIKSILSEIASSVKIIEITLKETSLYLKNDSSRTLMLKVIINSSNSNNRLLLPYILPYLKKVSKEKKLAAEAICSIGKFAIPPLYARINNLEYDQGLILKIFEVLSLAHNISCDKILLYENKKNIIPIIKINKHFLSNILDKIYHCSDKEKLDEWNDVLIAIKIGPKQNYLLAKIIKCLSKKIIQNNRIAESLLDMIILIEKTSPKLDPIIIDLLNRLDLQHKIKTIITMSNSEIIKKKILEKIKTRSFNYIYYIELSGHLKMKTILPMVTDLVKNDQVSTKVIAITSIAKIQNQYTFELQQLLKEINTSKWTCYINMQLATLGSVASPAMPILKNQSTSKEKNIRSSALLALYSISGNFSYAKEIILTVPHSQTIIDNITQHNKTFEVFFDFIIRNSKNPHLFLDTYLKIHKPSREKVMLLFQRLLQHRSSKVRLYLLDKLYQLNASPQVFIKYLTQEASVDEWECIVKTIHILSCLKSKKSKQILTKILSQPYEWNQRAMARIILQNKNSTK